MKPNFALLLILFFVTTNLFSQSNESKNLEAITKYGLHSRLMAQEGKGKELASILLKASKLVSTAKGCYLYLVSIDTVDNDSVWITEIWDSKEDHDNSLTAPEVRQLISTAIPILSPKQEKGQELTVLGGTGLNKSPSGQ